MELKAKITLLAEGCRGNLSKQVISKYNLREGRDPQIYGIGLKEVTLECDAVEADETRCGS